MQRIQCSLLSILLVAAVAPSHQLTSQGQALQSWRNATRYRSHSIQTIDWESESATISFKNDSEYLTEGPPQEADYLPEGLPGQPTGFKFRQYSGYVTVDAKAGRALFYYFAEATRNPSKKPLVLWLNGGPGCSSIGYGAMAELGPFRVNPDGRTLSYNPYAWNQAANVLFLESPAGVGFSYTNTTSDYTQTGDKLTAEESYAFLVNWFNRFPEYKSRKFYIAGESYAGYYIPELASKILQHKNLSQASFINFRGIMVGNGVMNSDTDFIGTFQYAWSHALISDQLYEQVTGSCIGSKFDIDLCNDLEVLAYNEMGNIDIYSIYAPICIANSSELARQEETEIPGYDPCIDNYVSTYFNRPDVQKAIHANVTNITYSWTQCSDVLFWADSASTVLPIYRQLIASGLRILVFSGDTDSRVPVTSTKLSINELKLPIETPWYPWVSGDEVGGYSVIYKGLTFATVRGAGHEVPEFQPSRALTLFKYFVNEKDLPK
jgi:serine carboxypeptidase-like clade 2